jgi:hypothetical protein
MVGRYTFYSSRHESAASASGMAAVGGGGRQHLVTTKPVSVTRKPCFTHWHKKGVADSMFSEKVVFNVSEKACTEGEGYRYASPATH